MRNLKDYVERLNFWRKHSNKPVMTFPLSSKDVEDIVYNLEGDLSPENLHCDGEISRAEAQRKYNYYMKVWDEMCKHIGHVPVVSQYSELGDL